LLCHEMLGVVDRHGDDGFAHFYLKRVAALPPRADIRQRDWNVRYGRALAVSYCFFEWTPLDLNGCRACQCKQCARWYRPCRQRLAEIHR
jgi:hypothetical protein